MTNEETALADKILKEATAETEISQRGVLIRQYQDVVCASINRREAVEPRRELCHATAMLRSTAEE